MSACRTVVVGSAGRLSGAAPAVVVVVVVRASADVFAVHTTG